MPFTTMTKATLRSLIQQWLDDPNARLWTAPNLDLLIEVTQDELFARLHERFPYFTSQLDTVAALTTPGFINTALSGGHLSKRLHRVQSIVRDGQEYGEVDRRRVLLEGGEVKTWASWPSFGYVFLGEQVHLFPYDTTKAAEVRYAFKPTRFTTLLDADAVQWPDGHESALIFECARRATAKGSREDDSQLGRLAQEAWDALIVTLERRSHGPKMPFYSDTPQEYGGE